MAADSPRAATSSSWWRFISVRIPRRRCVGATATAVTPATGSETPPGTVMSNGYDAVAPTSRPRSNVPNARSIGMSDRSMSSHPSGR